MSRVLSLLAIFALPLSAAIRDTAPPIELHYAPGQAATENAPVEIQSARGTRYLLAFAPECGGKHADNFEVDLALYSQGDDRCKQNLLVSSGNWHGPEPFMFLAWDLVHGPAGSLYGNERIFDLPRLGFRLHVHLNQVDVAPGPPHLRETAPDDKLRTLTITISTERYSTKSSAKR